MTLQGRVRAAQALQRSGLDVQSAGPLERASSITNEVWYAGPWVVRVNARPRRGNLRHEADVARLLPPDVGYPEVIDYGDQASYEGTDFCARFANHGFPSCRFGASPG